MIAEELRAAASGPTWRRNPDGSYVGIGFSNGPVELKRSGKSWVMVVGGQECDLGRRATFDTAERKLAQLRVGR